MKDGYRIEKMRPCPKELEGVGEPMGLEWVIIRNHDDEPLSIYSTREEAESALREVLTPPTQTARLK